MLNFLDVVKWVECLNPTEMNDVMVVEDVDDNANFVTVRHLQNNQISRERDFNLKYVGRCTPYENIKDIIDRYKNL